LQWIDHRREGKQVLAHELTGAFSDALRACGGFSTVVSPQGLADAVAEIVDHREIVLIGPDVAPLGDDLRGRGIDARSGSSEQLSGATPLAPAAADPAEFSAVVSRATCAVTGALLGIAASGTVAVDTRRGNAGLLSCLPPHHVVILRERSIESCLADALEVLAQQASAEGTGFVLITGPSRTSDIEMMSVLGVHGPLRLDVVVVREDA
jgi:L-lactate utilization protein LutC